jgi:hypothetical protein
VISVERGRDNAPLRFRAGVIGQQTALSELHRYLKDTAKDSLPLVGKGAVKEQICAEFLALRV